MEGLQTEKHGASLPESARDGSPNRTVAGRPSRARAHPPVLPLVQVLRGLAALSIAFLHMTQQAGAFVGRPGEPAYDWLKPLPWDAGVHVFFVISGFVMVWASLPLFGRPGAPRLFAARRVARVAPLYWAATALFVATAALAPGSVSEGAPTPSYVLASVLFLPWRRPDGLIQPALGLGWTLNFEMLFYAIFAAFVGFRARIAVPCVIGAVAALACAGWLLQPAWTPLAFWTNPIVLEFAFGAALAAVATRISASAALRGGLALAGVAGLSVAQHLAIPEGVVYGLPCVAIVAAAVLGPACPVRSRPMRFGVRLGDASYALYLSHPFPMRALALIWPRTGLTGEPGVLAYVGAATAASVVFAFLVHRWVERPLTAAARSWLAV